MLIEEFVNKSIGRWRSMRTGHSLAFRQFEDILSDLEISEVDNDNKSLSQLLNNKRPELNELSPVKAFQMKWEADSDWNENQDEENLSGECIIVPYPIDLTRGLLLRSVGYAESEEAVSTYNFLSDGTFILITDYEQCRAEERIWFASENIRCRSSIIRTSEGSGVLQTSYASEIRRIEIKAEAE